MTPERFTTARRTLSQRLVSVLVALFRNLGSWRAADVQRFTVQAVPLVQGSQRALAGLVATYIATQATEALGRLVVPPGMPDSAVLGLRGVAPAEVYSRPFVTIYTALSRGEEFPDALDRGATRLREVAELDMQQTHAHASRAAMQALPREAQPSGWRRVLVGPESCALCVVASTQLYRVELLNPVHPSCVPPWTQVRAGSVKAMTRRWYSGEVAVIATSRGETLTITLNHPVLTHRGWVPGHHVREGDRLVRSATLDGDRFGPYEQQRPTLVEDVWGSLNVAGGMHVVQRAEDFHGDGSDGEINVVRTDSHLSPVRHASSFKEVGEGGFEAKHRRRLEFLGESLSSPGVPGSSPASVALLRRSREFTALLGCHGLCSQHGGSGVAPDGHPVFSQYPVDDLAAGSISAAKFMHARASGVPRDYFGRWDIGSYLSFAAPWDQSHSLEFPSDRVGVDPNDGRDVLAGLPGGVELVDVIGTVRTEFRGHVYNLQTGSGYYEANNHIVHNCDCRVEPYFGAPEHVIEPELLERVHAAVEDITGSPDRGARAPDYRQIMTSMVHEHGELGPMLARPRDRFTTADEIPTAS